MKKFSIFLIALVGFALSTVAQDFIQFRNGTSKEVKIIEIGVDDIKYKDWPASIEAPVIAVAKGKIAKIVMENGQVYEFASDDFNDKELYADQKKNAIKINFLSPLMGVFYVGFERSVKPGQSFEADLGIVGLGLDVAEINPRGVVLRGGYKFIKTPDYYVKGMRYSHILKGGYIKPELIFSTYSFDSDNGFYDQFGNYIISKSRQSNIGGALVINLGKQWVYSDIFLFDVYGGLGYGFSTDSDVNAFGFVGGNSNVPIAATFGVRIGLLVK